MVESKTLLASELFALSYGETCKGDQECHWCASPCDKRTMHNDVPPVNIGVRTKLTTFAKRPSSPWICRGCALFRQSSITAFFLSGGLQDRQTPANHSWWMDVKQARAIRLFDPFEIVPALKEGQEKKWRDHESLYQMMLKPPIPFCLMLLRPDDSKYAPPKPRPNITENRIQYGVVNDPLVILADTPLIFTIDNAPFQYTVHELEYALTYGTEGREPAIRTLIEMVGPYSLPKPVEEVLKQGRPKVEPLPKTILKKPITKSD